MSITVLTTGNLLVSDELREEASEVVREAHDRQITSVSIGLDDGSDMALPNELVALVRHVLNGTSQGAMSIATFPPELTSTTAADLLAVSRPTLMKLVEEGSLGSRRVGSHHRFDTVSVLELAKRRSAERVDKFAALRQFDDEFENE